MPQHSPDKDEPKRVALALQGGGTHGAFAWGVLDRLLEEEQLDIEGISATSAGAMNAVLVASGWTMGGRDAARQALRAFWRRIGHLGSVSFLQPSPIDRVLEDRRLRFSPAFHLFDLMTRMFSPYELNPANFNPVEAILRDLVDFDGLRRHSPIKLFLAATNVRTGKIRIFTTEEVDIRAVLASACLPHLFQAVEIAGEAYWDGGYMGNPAIFPLIYGCESADIVIVHVNPIRRDEVPTSATEILNRINEISFNSSLMREMRAIAFITRLIDEGKVVDGSLRRTRIHAIAAEEVMRELSAASKLNADWEFLHWLHGVGRNYAEEWLQRSLPRVGQTSTVDVAAVYT